MADSLKANPAGTPPPPGAQTVSITEAQGQATNSVQIPPGSKGTIWFLFEISEPSVNLTVTFNGHTYNNVPPGQYTLSGLKTPLDLTLALNSGSAKLAWIVVS